MIDQLNIRSIQHFLYCPHRWGLQEIEQAWAENYFIARANLMHKRVDSAIQYMGRGKKVNTAVQVWNDELGIYGVVDCLESYADKLVIVEYKPTMPQNASYCDDDAMQVFAQKVCVDKVFSCNSEAVLYYAKKKRRIALPFDTEYQLWHDRLNATLRQMRDAFDKGIVPPVRKNQYCGGCSMKDVCIPEALKKKKSVRADINRIIETGDEV